MRYSASTISNSPRRATKILYQVVRYPSQILAKQHFALEELSMPVPLLSGIQNDLEASNLILPIPARTFQGWKVGFLDRHDTAS